MFLEDVADVRAGPDQPEQYVRFGTGAAAQTRGIELAGDAPAVTIAISKKPGETPSTSPTSVIARIEALRGTYIPEGVEATVTRNYGVTANDKAQKLIQKLMFATASVVVLVIVADGVARSRSWWARRSSSRWRRRCSPPGPGASRSTAFRCSR